MSANDIFAVLSEVRRRATEAVIGQSALNHAGLNAEIRRRFNSPDPSEGGLLAEPIVEAAPRYMEADRSMAELGGDLLSPDLVDVLDGARGEPPHGRDRYVFRRGWRPYEHQLAAWRTLLAAEPHSVLVTSGTGSGKTECFLIPILEDLVRQGAKARDAGVQAIVLYPLNALIASQEERLSDWTRPFQGRMRFALYNGLMPDREPAWKRDARPEAAIDRATLRATPPPILVTNVTMLEYMLLRKEDRPILDASRGKLKYIVLDEAHSYVGAQAAEIALLLRRVCLAFGVRPQDVRFIATSATIGGPDATEELQRFLADVSGAPLASVSVIQGRARWPQLPPVGAASSLDTDLEGLSDEQTFTRLSTDPTVRPLLQRLQNEPVRWELLEQTAATLNCSATTLASSLARAKMGDEPLSPLRLHAFHRSVSGLWTCLNPRCPSSKPAGWVFGPVFATDEERCPHCRSATFEIVHCSDCGEAWAEALEQSNGALIRPVRRTIRDEFSADLEEPEREEDEEASGGDAADDGLHPGYERLLSVRPEPSDMRHPLRPLFVDVASSTTRDGPGNGVDRFLSVPRNCGCSACGAEPDLVRPLTFGTPFLLPVAVPIVLDAVPPGTKGTTSQPLNGRQLLTFTDSRQGTARLSAKLQIAGERNLVRSIIYHEVQRLLQAAPDTSDLDQSIEALRPLVASNPGLEGTLHNIEKQREDRLRAATSGAGWNDLVERLASRPDVEALRQLWFDRDDRYERTEAFGHFLLLRELLRRPRRANTAETLGLARLSFREIDDLSSSAVPSAFARLGGDHQSWKEFLAFLVTHVGRAYSAVDASPDDQHWIQPKVKLKWLVRERAASKGGEVRWPWIAQKGAIGRASRSVALLQQAFQLDFEDRSVRSEVEDCLDTAWQQLSRIMVVEGDRRRLDLRKARVAAVNEAWWCPRSRRLLDQTFKGLSPYGAESLGSPPVAALRLSMPGHPHPFPNHEAKEAVRDWLIGDEKIQMLRELGAWSNLSDRVALFADYFRSAEHSAQQPPQLLRRYETEFKVGEINVLNCSTTMEMGVDIGSVSAVVMTNTPPSLASYRQRVGRAGRRGQGVSLAFTICKDRPLDRDAFADPINYLKRTVRAPRVALHSPVIVQRHVNALLFADFMQSASGDALRLQAGAFFGCEAASGASLQAENPAILLARHARQPSTLERLSSAMRWLTAGSVLEADPNLHEVAAATMDRIRGAFVAEWKSLQALVQSGGEAVVLRGVQIQLRRLCEDYLLGVLAQRGFLPSHGFPTGVVSFRCRLGDEGPSPVGRKAWPQRSLDVALREYAPGAEVVLDGLVHKSAGVTLNWKKPVSAEDAQREIQNLLWRWRCPHCTQAGTERIRDTGDACPSCGQGAAWFRYMEPAGFAADLRERPHANSDDITHVPTHPPVVSTGSVAWTSLFDPKVGRMRSNPAGTVFYCSAADGAGYKLCLHCGRAEPEDDSDEIWNHRPLVGKASVGGSCEGASKPFGVQRRLLLGHEITTDVFELQVPAVADRGAGLALGSALRESLSRRLGVEADEMGLAAEQRQGPVGRCVSVFLFDNASGGAGFAEQADSLFYELLEPARRILDCPVPGCVRGCPACVLTGDMNEEDAAELDRSAALGIVNDLMFDAAPDPDDFAAPGSRICRHVLDAVERRARDFRSVTVRIEGHLDAATLHEWSGRDTVRRLRQSGLAATVSVSPVVLNGLDGASLLSFRDWLVDLDAQLECSEGRQFANGARAFVDLVGTNGDTLTFATRDDAALSASSAWGQPQQHPIVMFPLAEPSLRGKPVARATLAPSSSASVRLLKAELDGDIRNFGSKAAQLLRRMLSEAGCHPSGIRRFVYADRYLNSPLTARLCIDTLAALTEGGTELLLRIEPVRKSDRWPRSIPHDWKEDDMRAAVLAACGRAKGMPTQVAVGPQAHGRRLDIDFTDGRSARIWLDQGFGPWRLARDIAFDFRADAGAQAKHLLDINAPLSAWGETYLVAERMAASEPAQ